MTEALGIERMVLVQPSFYGTDNSLLGDVLKRLGPRCGGVVRIAEDTSDAELDEFHELGVRADQARPVRPRQAGRPRSSSPTSGGWPPAPRRAAGTCSSTRRATIVRDLLPFLADLEDTFVIDHMGYLTESDPEFDRRLLAVLGPGQLLDQAVRRVPGGEGQAAQLRRPAGAAPSSRPAPTA